MPSLCCIMLRGYSAEPIAHGPAQKLSSLATNLPSFLPSTVLDTRVGRTVDDSSPSSLSSVSRSNLSVDNPVHSAKLSIHLFLGLPLPLVPGTVPCIISFSRQSPCFLIVCPKYDNFLPLIFFQ